MFAAYFLVILKFPSTCTAVGLLYICTLAAGPRTVSIASGFVEIYIYIKNKKLRTSSTFFETSGFYKARSDHDLRYKDLMFYFILSYKSDGLVKSV